MKESQSLIGSKKIFSDEVLEVYNFNINLIKISQSISYRSKNNPAFKNHVITVTNVNGEMKVDKILQFITVDE